MARSVDEVAEAIAASWSRETAYASEAYLDAGRHGDRSRGQCGTTAMVVQDLLGGELVVASVLRDGDPIGVHYWNRLPGGLEIDLTRDQLVPEESLADAREVPRPSGLPVHGLEPYLLLSQRVRALLTPRAAP